MYRQSIKLFEETREDISISIYAKISKDDDLVIEGFDSGPLVMKLMGDMDYEYYLTVRSVDKQVLLSRLKETNPQVTNDKELLQWISENYCENNAFSSFQSLLDSQEIKYEIYTWR